MNHDLIQQQLHAYLDNELSPGERPIVEDHLKSCGECTELARDWKLISSSLFRQTTGPNTDFFITKVMARLENATSAGAFPAWRWLAPALGLVSLLLIFTTPPEHRVSPTSDVLYANGESADAFLEVSDEPEIDALLQPATEQI